MPLARHMVHAQLARDLVQISNLMTLGLEHVDMGIRRARERTYSPGAHCSELMVVSLLGCVQNMQWVWGCFRGCAGIAIGLR